jgi:hypothetical protein
VRLWITGSKESHLAHTFTVYVKEKEVPQTMYVLTNLEPNGNIVHWVVGNYETLHNGWNRVIPMEGAPIFWMIPITNVVSVNRRKK